MNRSGSKMMILTLAVALGLSLTAAASNFVDKFDANSLESGNYVWTVNPAGQQQFTYNDATDEIVFPQVFHQFFKRSVNTVDVGETVIAQSKLVAEQATSEFGLFLTDNQSGVVHPKNDLNVVGFAVTNLTKSKGYLSIYRKENGVATNYTIPADPSTSLVDVKIGHTFVFECRRKIVGSNGVFEFSVRNQSGEFVFSETVVMPATFANKTLYPAACTSDVTLTPPPTYNIKFNLQQFMVFDTPPAGTNFVDDFTTDPIAGGFYFLSDPNFVYDDVNDALVFPRYGSVNATRKYNPLEVGEGVKADIRLTEELDFSRFGLFLSENFRSTVRAVDQDTVVGIQLSNKRLISQSDPNDPNTAVYAGVEAQLILKDKSTTDEAADPNFMWPYALDLTDQDVYTFGILRTDYNKWTLSVRGEQVGLIWEESVTPDLNISLGNGDPQYPLVSTAASGTIAVQRFQAGSNVIDNRLNFFDNFEQNTLAAPLKFYRTYMKTVDPNAPGIIAWDAIDKEVDWSASNGQLFRRLNKVRAGETITADIRWESGNYSDFGLFLATDWTGPGFTGGKDIDAYTGDCIGISLIKAGAPTANGNGVTIRCKENGVWTLNEDNDKAAINPAFALTPGRVYTFKVQVSATDDRDITLSVSSAEDGLIYTETVTDFAGTVRPAYVAVCTSGTINMSVEKINAGLPGAVIPKYCSDVWAEGHGFAGDLNKDCYVDIDDLLLLAADWVDCSVPGGAGCMSYESPSNTFTMTIPNGTATVDGNLSEWASAPEWYQLNDVYSDTPLDITENRYALRWNTTNDKLYLAVVVKDTSHVFKDAPNATFEDSDRIEVYSQGSAAGGLTYSPAFAVAQQYLVGPNSLGTSAWGRWADPNQTDPAKYAVNPDAGFEYAVKVEGDYIYYECAITQFDNYGGRNSTTTAIKNLAAGAEVGFDVVLGSRTASGVWGMKAENTDTGKFEDAGKFGLYTLVNTWSPLSLTCGAWGYASADVSHNCRVDLHDFAAMASKWVECNDPQVAGCETIIW